MFSDFTYPLTCKRKKPRYATISIHVCLHLFYKEAKYSNMYKTFKQDCKNIK